MSWGNTACAHWALPPTGVHGVRVLGTHRPHPCAALTLSFPAPDIDPAWYTGRRIRPVGRFGRRRAALRDVAKPSLWRQPACFPLQGGAEPARDG
ncbi:unnamed protein product [Gulo gulo]|uniref:Prolactin-releasing peptide n=1 Tax=Gulo gulo TaxID=48420 RepID=A0A9X9LCJ5_GULGU|nr:unnamed protein product [Gulo gulo]